MKKILLALVAIMVLTGCADSKDSNTLTVATSPDYPPYEFFNKNAGEGELPYLGADIELAKYVAEKLGKELVISAVEFKSIPTAIAAKKYDIGISGFTYEKERAEIIDFSISYDTSESACQGILVKKDKAAEYTSLEDFDSLKIAVQNASAQLGYVNEQLPNATVQLVANLNDAVLQLKTDKVDAVAISCASGTAQASANSDVVMSDIQFKVNPDDGTMIIVPKGSDDLLKQINTIIEEVKEKDLYTKWHQEAVQQAKELGLESDE